MSDPRPTLGKWAGLAAGLSVLVRAPVLKMLGREPDAWRRTLGLGLRSEGTRFALSSFSLRIPSQPSASSADPEDITGRFLSHFARFIVTEPDAHFILKHHLHYVERVSVPRVDLMQCDYNPGGELLAFKPHLDSRIAVTLDAAARQIVQLIILRVHRSTRFLSDIVRFRELEQEVHRKITAHAGLRDKKECTDYAGRILSACAMSSEAMPEGPCARFLPPDFRRRRGFGGGPFDIVIRPLAEGCVDLWLNIHHAAADGAPMQEMLSRLEIAWGRGETVLFPAFDPARAPFIQECQSASEDRLICLLVDFLDFTSLSVCRELLNAKLKTRLNHPVPLAAILLWALAKEPEFAGRKFATAVDVPANKRWPRAVDLVTIRPEDYFTWPDGFLNFVYEFIGTVNAGQSRQSPTYAAMRALSWVAPRYAAEALASNPGRSRAVFGTVGLSILKNAMVFVAPMADKGWDDGFIAISNLSLPAGNGRTVGVLTVKGDRERVTACAQAFRRTLARADRLFGDIL